MPQSSYRLPATGPKCMLDFYVVWAFWKDQEKDGVPPAAGMTSTAPVEQFHALFQSCVYQLAEAIIKELQVVVYNEVANMCRPYLIPPEVLRVWLTESTQPSTRKLFLKSYDPKEEEFIPPDFKEYWAKVGLMGTIRIMQARSGSIGL